MDKYNVMILTNTRETLSFRINRLDQFKKQALQWAAQFEVCCFLDSNQQKQIDKSYDFLLGTGSEAQLFKTQESGFDALRNFYNLHHDWLFGFLTYDLKNDVENLSSSNPDHLGFPKLHFFQPSVVIESQSKQVLIHTIGISPKLVFRQIKAIRLNSSNAPLANVQVSKRITKKDYLKTVERIKEHIVEGDIYEMNFCQEFYAENCVINPLDIYNRLNALAKAPFSVFYKLKNKYLLCASPERYLKKEKNKLTSQPIKGTIRRGETLPEDQRLKDHLYNSEKDRAENVMIVDLVRNDLARICQSGSIQVKELFGVYAFEQVFQMISTIEGELKPDRHLVDALEYTFPMGSMTGAPKVMAMQLIERYEQTRRGLYSGAVGYIKPDGDFDFNVVIRSILYDTLTEYLSFQVGGAIVYDSVAEKEYEECLLKAKAILEILGVNKKAWATPD